MEEKILQELAEIILAEAKHKSHETLVTNVLKEAHLNGSIFNPRRMFHHSAIVFIRFLINIAAQIGKSKFKDMMSRFSDMIWQIADDDDLVKEINNNHAAAHE